jgi:NAD(P)H dehydrogenase (quinone)
MNTLIVTAHPSSKGFTHEIANKFAETRRKLGYTVEILDLYKTDLKQDYFAYEELRTMPADPVKAAMQKKITDANEVVFIHPLWWMGPPAIMKNYIDVNFAARFAYRYLPPSNPNSKMGKRVGLLHGKTARVFITCDGSRWTYLALGLPFAVIWVLCILTYNGMTMGNFTLLDRKMFRTREYLDNFLKKVEKIASKPLKIPKRVDVPYVPPAPAAVTATPVPPVSATPAPVTIENNK